jgi:1-acyl-sn-glycerol-3-phosphate acyltransferase
LVPLWKIYGLLIVYIPIIILTPILLVIIASDNLIVFWKIQRLWAQWIVFMMGFRPVKIKSSYNYHPNRQYIIVANHTSMIDIPFMLTILKIPITFVGKKELARYPLFGYFYKKTNVLVDRKSLKSRKEVYDQVENFIKKGLSIVIFPEGGVPDHKIDLAPFKNGAFRIAIEHKLPLLPIVFYDNKRLLPYDFFKGNPGKMHYKILPAIETESLSEEDMQELKNYVYTLLYNELKNYELVRKKIAVPEDVNL